MTKRLPHSRLLTVPVHHPHPHAPQLLQQVPIGNRQVHEVRCARVTPPDEPSSPAAAVFGWGDDSPNVFTPSPPCPPLTPPQPAAAAPWREVDIQEVASMAAMERARREHGRPSHRAEAAGSSEQAPGSSPTRATNEYWESDLGATYADIAAGVAFTEQPEGARGGGGGGSSQGSGGSEWACKTCTYLNARRSTRCDMCGDRMPPEERPPDGTFRDTLIDDYVEVRHNAPRRRPAATAASLSASAEAARSRLVEQARGGVTTSGGGSGGHARGCAPDGTDSGSIIYDAAAGSTIGAFGAGMLSALTPGTRPRHVFASMMQGALVGGAAGAAIGGRLRQEPEGDSNPERGDGERRNGAGAAGLSRGAARAPRQRRVSIEFGDPWRRIQADPDLEMMLLTQHLREMGLSEAATLEMLGELEPPAMPGTIRVDGSRRGATPASAHSIAALPVETVTAESMRHLRDDGHQCCICLEDFDAEEVVTRLPCLHVYHTVCIQNWLNTSGTCPQCKHRVG